jgi:hypothetical protein
VTLFKEVNPNKYTYGLFNDAVSSSAYIVQNDVLSNECSGIDVEVGMAKNKVLFWHFPGGAKENHEICHDSQSLGRDMNPGHPEYEAGVLSTQL